MRMIKHKLLTGSILLLFCWILFFFILKVGGVVHFMLVLSVVAFLAQNYYNDNIALKH